MDYSSYRHLKVRALEPGILEIVMGEEGKLAVATAKEGIASHREKRKPSFPPEPKDF